MRRAPKRQQQGDEHCFHGDAESSLRKRPRVFQPMSRRQMYGGMSSDMSDWLSCHDAFDGERVISYGASGILDPEKRDFSGQTQKVLKVAMVDYKIKQNTVSHHTDEYSITEAKDFGRPELVIRRGQAFDVEIIFNRDFVKGSDDVKLQFLIGDNPIPSKGTRVEILLSDEDLPKQWGAKVKSCKGKALTISIITPPNCFIGKWSLHIDSKVQGDETSLRFRNDRKIYVLFNPWCKDDAVFMPDESDREEYVMEDTGKIFVGTQRTKNGRPWNFAQFEDYVLECAMKLLDNSGLGWSARGDPVKMVRKLTSLCNSPDNTGILSGNWSGDYSDGISPVKWTGSQNILKMYYLTEKPVKFGQCWVFSGVLTTVCRTLGIPARSVTNFASAHDADNTITIDTYYNVEGDAMDILNVDSVWNFHVWNEAYMARSDLPLGYGGWQVVDATPQETSEGVYCCGPASLVAVKRGEVNWPYDGGFVFAEVNADRVNWMKQEDGTWSKMFVKNSVGKFISTKRKGEVDERLRMFDDQRSDITSHYKHEEGSDAERTAVLNAQKCNTSSVTLGAGTIYQKGTEDVEFTLEELDAIPYGDAFTVMLKVVNKSKAKRTVTAYLKAAAVPYTSAQQSIITKSSEELILDPNQCGQLSLKVTFDDYQDECYEHTCVRMSCLARVTETNQVFNKADDFALTKPVLVIACKKQVRVGEALDVSFSFTNPLKVTLTKCTLEVTGPGFQSGEPIKMANVGENGKFHYKTTITPQKAGRKGRKRQLIAKFSSKQIDDIDGTIRIDVVQ